MSKVREARAKLDRRRSDDNILTQKLADIEHEISDLVCSSCLTTIKLSE
jgi:hypothetical protein